MAEYREKQDLGGAFPSTPDARVYFPASTFEKARKATGRCLRRGEGAALVIGGTGVGKTLLARALESEFNSDDLVAVVSASRRLNVKSFLQQFLYSLRQTFSGCDETELRLMAFDCIERAPQKRCSLLIDDAQNLTLRVFDELRTLIDRSAAASKQTTVALFGSMALEERLNIPQLYSFNQRIVSRSYLDPFSQQETVDYIARELRRAKLGVVFSTDAREKVAKLSDGVPRVINQLCDRILVLALEPLAETKRTESITVEVDDVERAWRDLQNLPEETKPRGFSGFSSDMSVVEFGILDDDDDEEYNNAEKGKTVETSETIVAGSANEETVDAVENALNGEETVDVQDEQKEALEESEMAEEVVSEEASEEITEEVVSETTEEAIEVSAVEEAEEIAEASDSEEVASPNADETVAVPPELDAAISSVLDSARELQSQKERRERARNAFWALDERAVEAEQTRNAVDAAIDSLDEVSTEAFAVGSDEEEIDEEEEEAANFNAEDFDADLDARLREKFGFGLRSKDEEVDEEASELDESENVVYRDGMKFELRGGSEENLSELNGAQTRRGYDEALTLTRDSSARYEGILPKSTTRRRISLTSGDGSREYYEANGFNAEDFAKLAADDRDLEERYNIPRPVKSEAISKLDALAPNASVLDDKLYRQVAASIDRTVSDMGASDQYLNELQLLEQEITEEANLIRRIRGIHLRLRAAATGRPPKELGERGSVAVASK